MNTPGLAVVDALNEQHVQQLVSLYQNEWWSRGRTVNDVRQMLAGSDYVFALCTDPGGQLAAFARVLTDGVFKALLLDVIVAPDFRGQGLGRRLMDAVASHPALDRVRHIELYCLPEMVPFYEQWGFLTDVSGVTFMRRTTG